MPSPLDQRKPIYMKIQWIDQRIKVDKSVSQRISWWINKYTYNSIDKIRARLGSYEDVWLESFVRTNGFTTFPNIMFSNNLFHDKFKHIFARTIGFTIFSARNNGLEHVQQQCYWNIWFHNISENNMANTSVLQRF